VLHTPLPEVRRMPAHEAIDWHHEAARIAKVQMMKHPPG